MTLRTGLQPQAGAVHLLPGALMNTAGAPAGAPVDVVVDLAAAAAALDQLPTLVRTTRRTRRLSLVQVAASTGLSVGTVQRVETGQGCYSSSAAILLRWLDADGGPR